MILEWVGNEVRGSELGNINVGNVASVTFLLVLLAYTELLNHRLWTHCQGAKLRVSFVLH